MTKRTTIIVLITFMTISLFALFFWGLPMTDEKLKKEYLKFYNANLDGVVERVGIKYHQASFTMKGIVNEYVFNPYTDKELNDDKIFNHIAQCGDKIFKPAKGDTLFLKHGDKLYKYTFQKDN